MTTFRVYLFGKFTLRAASDSKELNIEAQKARELFCFLLLNSNTHHCREKLATLLWNDSRESQSRQYLRRALWQLQTSLTEHGIPFDSIIKIQSDWVRINESQPYWADIEQLDRAFHLTHGSRGSNLDVQSIRQLERAVKLYHGHLLENWYYDWCLLERRRFKDKYLIILDKLMSYFASIDDYETGIKYGTKSLRCDIARERTYRRLMRIHYLAGDRSGALRLFQRCSELLDQEFGVEPDQSTISLNERIKEGSVLSAQTPAQLPVEGMSHSTDLTMVFEHLENISQSLTEVQNVLLSEMDTLQKLIHKQ